jgi:ribosome-binding ATPase YchF (GTP1/OBG family)
MSLQPQKPAPGPLTARRQLFILVMQVIVLLALGGTLLTSRWDREERKQKFDEQTKQVQAQLDSLKQIEQELEKRKQQLGEKEKQLQKLQAELDRRDQHGHDKPVPSAKASAAENKSN